MRNIHVVSHTHWDREWYLTFQQFRLKLVQMVDELLDLLEKDPDYKHFMLDGQTIVLEDYLQMRPEREAELREHIQKGRISIGPWYILPDMFLVGPEAHIRNLLEGGRTAQKFGSKMMAGYMPDSFGHIGQMPQILRGFNIVTACLWRGLDEDPCELAWQSPDGSRVLLAYLRDSYSNGASLPIPETGPVLNGEDFDEALDHQAQSLADHSVSNHLLIMLGTDHMQPAGGTSQSIAYANQHLSDTRVLHSTLEEYLSALQNSLELEKLPLVSGELRQCRRMHLLPGVLSNRIWIEQRNHTAENLLTRWVEPFSAFADGMLPAAELGRLRAQNGIIRQAWRLLMQNHPHDSICGCSIDPVCEEMHTRFDQVDQIAEDLLRQNLDAIGSQVNTSGSGQAAALSGAVIVFNPSSFLRTDLVSVEINLPPGTTSFALRDESGSELPFETLGQGVQELVNASLSQREFVTAFSTINEGRISGMGIRDFSTNLVGDTLFVDVTMSAGEPDMDVWNRAQKEVAAFIDNESVRTYQICGHTPELAIIVFTAPGIPGLGWRSFFIEVQSKPDVPAHPSRLNLALLPFLGRVARFPIGRLLIEWIRSDPASKPPHEIENNYFKIEVESTGTLSILDKTTGLLYKGQNHFIDGGDCGDEYNYSPPAVNPFYHSHLKSVSIRRGKVCQILTLNLVLRSAEGLTPDRKARSATLLRIPITTVITLTQDVPRIDIHTHIENRTRDHRLRVHFPVPFKVKSAAYDGHFEIIDRKIGLPAFDRKTWVEDPRPEVPQRALVDLSEEEHGLTLANRGLPEVEVLQSGTGSEIALTLLRSVGWLSRDDFQTRRGHAGPALETPAAQMPGLWEYDYSLIPHAGRKHVQPEIEAYAFETPLRTLVTPLQEGGLPSAGSFLSIHSSLLDDPSQPGNFILSAVKSCQEGQGWLVRGYNAGNDPLTLHLKPYRPFPQAARMNLAEERISPLPVDDQDGSITCQVNPHEIITIGFGDRMD